MISHVGRMNELPFDYLNLGNILLSHKKMKGGDDIESFQQ